jgi:arylsulfatase A-like enzyme
MTSMDLLPTFARLTGASLDKTRIIDGRDIWPLLAGEKGAKSPHEAFYYYHMDQLQAVRSGPWKFYLPLAARRGAPGAGQPSPARLYNLNDDLVEANNVAADHPKVVARLTTLADKARADLGDGDQPGQHQRPAGHVSPATPRVKS